MPNWVINNVTIESENAETISKLKELLTKEDGGVTFNKAVPMPKSLDTSSTIESVMAACAAKYAIEKYGVDAVGGKEIRTEFHGTKTVSKWASECDNNHFGDDQAKIWWDNYENYGCFDWYNWRIENWGTKWDACESSHCLSLDGLTLTLDFETAWSTPLEFFSKLSKMYPDAKIDVKYADENFGYNCGEYGLCENEPDYNYEREPENPEEFAHEMWGYSEDDFDEEGMLIDKCDLPDEEND